MARRRVIGGYTLIRQLDAGGNSTVYLAVAPSGDEVAFKLIENERGKHLRFGDEVAAHRMATGREGVLPLLDWFVPVDLSIDGPGWLVTPVAVRLDRHLAEPVLEEVVAAIGAVAATLFDLSVSDHHLSHRDIKPSNLFWWGDQAAVGDFGLADFEGKQDLTSGQHQLGARHFHAPEMLTDPESAAGPPADVYSLAKTLWVLATNQRWPPPGYQRREYLPNLLELVLRRPDAGHLDILIERATSEDPATRPSLGTMADELSAWLAERGERTPIPLLEQHRQTLATIRNRAEREGRISNTLNAQVHQGLQTTFGQLIECIAPIGQALVELGEHGHLDQARDLTVLLPLSEELELPTPGEGVTIVGARVATYMAGVTPRMEMTFVAIGYSDRTIRFALVESVAGAHQAKLIHSDVRPAQAIGSALLGREIDELAALCYQPARHTARCSRGRRSYR